MSMKRHFSCVVMIVTMLLFGASGVMQGSINVLDDLGRAAVKSLETAGAKGGAADVALFAKNIAKTVSGDVIKITDKYAAKILEEGADKVALKLAQDAEVKAAMDTALKSVDSIAGKVAKLSNLGVKAESVSVESLAKIASGSSEDFAKGLESMTLKGGTEAEAKLAGKLTEGEAKVLTQEFKQAEALVKGEAQAATKAGKISNAFRYVTNNLSLEQKAVEKVLKTDEAMKLIGSSSAAERKMGRAMLVKAERSPLTAFARKAGHYGGMALVGAIGTVYMAVLFMAPSLYQSKMLAEQHKNALLETYLPPVKFGNVVLQLPDSVVDVNNPMMSQFIYYGIPVNNPGEKLSPAAKAAYPGVSDPTAKNKLSKAISNDFALGMAKKVSVARYNLDATALATLPMYVSYSMQSYIPYASNGIPDTSFSQAMLNLNTGYVFFADGTSDGTPAVPLIGAKQQNGFDTIQSFMSVKLGNLKTMGMQATYTEFEQGLNSARAGKVSDPLTAQFDCSCLQGNNGALSGATMKACAAGKSCLLTPALNQLAAGLVINSQGTELQPGQDLDAEVANGALGQVIPIQGYGDQFNNILQAFPGAQQDALAGSGALTVSLGSNLQATSAPLIQGADPDNYVAKGVYVYQCKNTPLAKIMRSQSGGSPDSASQVTDYIVFLDANLNQVPMMAPVTDKNNYNFIKMGLNPAIKYFSTIIGNSDSNGGFTFLPQLNIQSPAALVAKGLPATFAPLYGLQATKGSLAINYNQNLPAAIGAIAQSLSANPKLGQQFKIMQNAMLGQLVGGPFGKYNLRPVSKSMQPSIGGVNLMLYTGFNGYPVSQDQASAACTDVLIALSAQGKTVTLPSNNVAQYYGLVTDVTYTVLADGSITVGATGYANSPFNSATWSIDATKASQYYWIDKLTAMGQGSDPNFAMPQGLVSFVQTARAAWIKWIKSTASSSEYLGVKVSGTANVLTIASQQALQNGLYIYTCSPCPSSAQQDYFVLTNSSAPQANDASLGSMSATKATASTNMLSLVSGILYSSAGTPVAGAPKVNAGALLKAIQSSKPQAIANDLAAKFNIAVGQAASTAMAMVYPYQFGGLQLGMYQVDVNTNTYLYFDASGAGASASFQPSDYFVSVDSYASPSSVQTELTGSTAFMVSLVSGDVYGPAGVVATMASSMVAKIIAKLSSSWRSGVAAQIANLTASVAQSAQDDAAVTDAMDNAPVPNSGVVTWPQASAMQVITAVSQLDYLAEPYSSLKQEPSSGTYVLVSPASVDGTQFLYTFFSVPSTILDASGNPTNVAATYDGQGNLLRVIQGIELVSMLRQYGVALDSTGKQYLGASNSLPVMQLDPADLALKPGVSGKSMIYSSDSKFPSYGIISPVSYNNMQYYIYYNNLTQAYYAMRVSGSDSCYIDMAGGSVYNLNGTSRMVANPVAANANGDATDLLLPYLNPDSFVRCVMKNADNNNAYSDFLNSEQDFQAFATDPATNNPCGLNLLYSLDDAASSVNIAQMPFPDTLTAMPDLSVTNQYNVYFDGSSDPVVYNINAAYTWQPLQILPIDMNSRALLNPAPADLYSSASLVMQSNKMYALVFAGQFFSGAQAAGTNSYTMSSGANKVTVSIKVDAKTNAQYIAIVAGSTTYNYQCSFLILSDGQLAEIRHNAWQAETVADVMGNILLEEYISIDASGNLQLVPVSVNNITNMPTDATAKSALTANLANVMQDGGNGRFVAAIDASTYSYVTQAGFVDLENGILFDATGLLLGFTLQINDMMALLSQLSVSVTRDSTNKAVLTYRAPSQAPIYAPATALAPQQMSTGSGAQPSAATSYSGSTTNQPAADSTPTYNPGTQTSSSQSSYVAPSTSGTTSTSTNSGLGTTSNVGMTTTGTGSTNSGLGSTSNVGMTTTGTGSTNSGLGTTSNVGTTTTGTTGTPSANAAQIAILKKQIEKTKADSVKRTEALKHEKVAARKAAQQKAIKMNNDEIAAETKQIAQLSAAAASRSDLLGRLSSDVKKKKVTSSKKSKHAATTKAMKGMAL